MKRGTRKMKRGGGYSFGGSILSDQGGAGAGNALWDNNTSQDCGSGMNRPGNSMQGGSRRRRRRRGGAISNDSLGSRGGNNGGSRRRRRRRGGMMKVKASTTSTVGTPTIKERDVAAADTLSKMPVTHAALALSSMREKGDDHDAHKGLLKLAKPNGSSRRHRRKRGGMMTEQQLRAHQVGSVVMAPRTGHSFDGSGVAGTANTIPYQ